MTELYPLLADDGSLVGVIGSGGDATKIAKIGGSGCKTFIWLSVDEAICMDSLIGGRGGISTREGYAPIPVASWLESAPYIHAEVTGSSLDSYVEWIARRTRRELRGKTILLGFSGGKDSVTALLVLLKLQEHIDFKLHPIYIHIPFLESPRSLKFVEEVARKLSIDIDIREAPRRVFRSMLRWRGMPRRGRRWCTMFKAKPMREIKKRDPRVIEVVADRLTESPKRLERLAKPAAHGVVLAGRKFRPTLYLSLIDVVEATRRANLVHPDYLEGIPRVACHLCPYKTLHEFRRIPELEDPGLVEEVVKRTWRKWYSRIPFEAFEEQRLWRFEPRIAESLYKLREKLSRIKEADRLRAEWVEEAYRRPWTRGVRAPKLDNPLQLAEHVFRGRRRKEDIIIVSS